jgi:hypothetical protein
MGAWILGFHVEQELEFLLEHGAWGMVSEALFHGEQRRAL